MARAGTRKPRASLAGTKKSDTKKTQKEVILNGNSNGHHIEKEEPMDTAETVEVVAADSTSESITKAGRKRKAQNDEELESKPRGNNRTATEEIEEQPAKAKKPRVTEEITHPSVSIKMPVVSKGRALAVGAGDIGQLGLGEDVMEKTRLALVPNVPEEIVAVAAGGLHSVCLDKEGNVHTWGCNDEGALGRKTTCEEDNFEAGKVEGIEGKVVQITAGDCHSAALTEEGKVYAWGTFRDNNGLLGFIERGNLQKSPLLLSINHKEPVTMIASGNNHLALLSASGRIYTCGCGESGQLGRLAEMFATRDSRNRNGFDVLLMPTMVKVFQRRKAVQFDGVWAGGENTFARDSSTGHIYAWGLNNYNQLGDPDTNTKYQPILLKSMKDRKWKQFSSGQHHSLAVTSEGALYSMGRHDYGRLGLGQERTKDAITPTLVESLKEEKVDSASAAGCVSLVVTESGKAYGFGMGTNNQLSQGEDEDCFVPTLLKGKQLESRTVKGASVGGQHSLVLACDS